MPTTTTDMPNDTGYASDEELSVTAELESNRVLQKIRDKTDAVVERIQPKIAAVSDYARNEPTKAVLIAAAAGAGADGPAGAARPRLAAGAGSSTGQRTMSAIRDAALDLADRAHSVATEAIGTAHKRASSAVDVAEHQAGEAKQRLEAMQKRASDVADSVAETWASLREQAAPVVDKLKPQIDALATYAKEDPARAALGVATAGADADRPAQPAPPLDPPLLPAPSGRAERGLTHLGGPFSRRAQSVVLLRRFPGRTVADVLPRAATLYRRLTGLAPPRWHSFRLATTCGGRPSVNKKIWATIVTSALVVACGGGSSSGDSTGGNRGGSGDDGTSYVAGPGPQGGAALYSDFRTGKKLVLHQRGIIEVTPATLRDRLATMESTLTAFDGAFLRLPTTGDADHQGHGGQGQRHRRRPAAALRAPADPLQVQLRGRPGAARPRRVRRLDGAARQHRRARQGGARRRAGGHRHRQREPGRAFASTIPTT